MLSSAGCGVGGLPYSCRKQVTGLENHSTGGDRLVLVRYGFYFYCSGFSTWTGLNSLTFCLLCKKSHVGTWVSWRHFCSMSLCLHHSGGMPNGWLLLTRNENMPEYLSTFASPSLTISWAKADFAPGHMWSSVGAILTFLGSTWKCIEVSGVVTMMGWHHWMPNILQCGG